jgi:hypothetical protein
MKKILAIALLCVVFSGVSQGQVRKCVGPNGKVTYSDFLCAGGTASETNVRTDANTIDSSAYRQKAQKMKSEEEVGKAMQLGASKCKFTYLAIGDAKGKELALAAKQECLDNIKAKATGQPTTLDAYNFWKDHSSQKSAERQSAITRAGAAANANATQQAIERAGSANRGSFTCKPNLLGNALDCN